MERRILVVECCCEVEASGTFTGDVDVEVVGTDTRDVEVEVVEEREVCELIPDTRIVV